jgi:type I restriction enzyme, R subunit
VTAFIAESAVEEVCLDFFADLGWTVLYGPNIAPDLPNAERISYREVLLEGRLRAAINRLNPALTSSEAADVAATFRRPESVDLKAENWRTYPSSGANRTDRFVLRWLG